MSSGKIILYVVFALLATALLGGTLVSAAPPDVPRTNDVARYEYDSPIFKSKQIPRERGDALLTLLDGGRAIDDWQRDTPSGKYICVLPVPPNLSMNIILTNGTNYNVRLSESGLLYLSDGLYTFTNAASNLAFKKWMTEMEGGFRREILSQIKPCAYTMGTLPDGGTLSGVARLFYGDASKWHLIYEANRSVIKNPNVISGAGKLMIPKS